jgi:nucleotide-binding universal stress UspA family protein
VPYGQILVPLDTSERAEAVLPVARALAKVFDASLQLVHVTRARDPAEEKAYLDAVAASLRADRVVTRVEQGWPVPVLADIVESNPSTVVCLATRARTGASALLLGSVADELLLDVHAPVVLAGSRFDANSVSALDGRGGRLVLCYDGSDVSAAITPLAVEWARTLDLEVHVVMVLHRDGTYLGNEDATVPKQRAHELVERLRATDIPVMLDLLDGLDPARQVGQHASDLGARLVVASTHGQGGLLRSALGSIALRVVHHTSCPVVVQRPQE